MSQSADDYMKRARIALDGARILLAHENASGACNRAYYAMFDAARAVLTAIDAEIDHGSIKTHAGLIGAFGRHAVMSGHIDAEWGRAFNRVEQMRLLADYSDQPLDIEDARIAVEMAAGFLQRIDEDVLSR